MMEWLDGELQKEEIVDEIDISPEQLKQGESFLTKLTVEWYPALRRLAKRALCSSVDQGYEDMRDFLLGYPSGYRTALAFSSVPLPAIPSTLLAESSASTRRNIGFTMFLSNSDE